MNNMEIIEEARPRIQKRVDEKLSHDGFIYQSDLVAIIADEIGCPLYQVPDALRGYMLLKGLGNSQ